MHETKEYIDHLDNLESSMRELVLDIKVELSTTGEINSVIGFSKRFFLHLKDKEDERKIFISELVEKLTGYIHGVK